MSIATLRRPDSPLLEAITPHSSAAFHVVRCGCGRPVWTGADGRPGTWAYTPGLALMHETGCSYRVTNARSYRASLRHIGAQCAADKGRHRREQRQQRAF